MTEFHEEREPREGGGYVSLIKDQDGNIYEMVEVDAEGREVLRSYSDRFASRPDDLTRVEEP